MKVRLIVSQRVEKIECRMSCPMNAVAILTSGRVAPVKSSGRDQPCKVFTYSPSLSAPQFFVSVASKKLS